jgi:hypothetical protein
MKAATSGYLIGLALICGGCATLIGGTSQTVSVNSNVDGAQVSLNDMPLGRTPLVTTLKRGQTGVLKVEAPGYQPYQIALNKKISSLFWVNILSGGSFGSTTDYATGAMYEYEPSTYMVSLQRGRASLEEKDQWRRSEGLRAFVLQNNEALVSDLAAGRGEYIDVLVGVLQVKPDTRAGAIERWRTDYSKSKTASEFAERMVAQLSH